MAEHNNSPFQAGESFSGALVFGNIAAAQAEEDSAGPVKAPTVAQIDLTWV